MPASRLPTAFLPQESTLHRWSLVLPTCVGEGAGAGEGNRTLVCSLGSCRSTLDPFAINTPQISVHRLAATESATTVAFVSHAASTTRVAIDRLSTVAGALDLTVRISMPPSPRPVRVRVLSRGIAMAGRDAASCGFAHASKPPGGVRQHRPSATTSGTCECTNARPRAPLMCIALKVSPRRARSQQPPRWSAERRASPVRRLRKLVCAGTQGACAMAPAGLRYWPADGCRCTRAPVGAPLPSLCDEGKQQTSEDKCLARTMMLA